MQLDFLPELSIQIGLVSPKFFFFSVSVTYNGIWVPCLVGIWKALWSLFIYLYPSSNLIAVTLSDENKTWTELELSWIMTLLSSAL